MRLSKPISRLARAVFTTLHTIVVELVSIAREMARIPARSFMRVAEALGEVVLAAWRVVWPVLVSGWSLAGRFLERAEEVLTPARAAVAVAAFAALALAASQFADYRSIAIGVPAYAEVEGVAAAPAVESAEAGSAHAWLGLPLAAAALVIVARAASGRWRAARLLAGVGIAVVAISLAIDMPKGLDEGDAALAYEGASAQLLGGFWAQLACGALLIALAPLLTRLLEPRARAAAAAAPRRVQRLRLTPPDGLRLPRLPRGRARVGGPTPEARG